MGCVPNNSNTNKVKKDAAVPALPIAGAAVNDNSPLSIAMELSKGVSTSINSEVNLILKTSSSLDVNTKQELTTITQDAQTIVAAQGANLLEESKSILDCAQSYELADCKDSVINSIAK